VPIHEKPYIWSDHRVPASPMSVGYRVGLLVVTLTMVLLPLVYVSLCLSVAYGLFLYATNETILLGYHQPGIAAYFGVIVAGCIGLVFMIKPLFTPKKKIKAHLEITQETQPELFQFIEEVCNRIGAPKPVRVLLDNQVNASASFENGIWGFFTNRLVLTIGLPLAQGLTVSQFGGVLAHEFGHFTQAAAMRLNYIIRSINRWFNRVIYERDSLDAKLTAWTKRGNLYWLIMANIAVCFVWLGRKLLWALMMAGHAVSAYMMRQMEYDADYYERQVTGKANFKDTFLRMRLINTGAQMAGNHLNYVWKTGKLVDNMPMLTGHLTASIPAENVQSFSATFEADKSVAKWHSTHPSDYQRIRHALTGQEGGVLAGENSAGILFHDLEGVAKQVTLIDYTGRLQLQVQPEKLISTTTYLEQSSLRSKRLVNMAAFFGGLLSENHLIFPVASIAGTGTLDETRNRLREITFYLTEQAGVIKTTSAKIESARASRARAIVAQVLMDMGIKIKASDFELADLKPKTIDDLITACSAEISQHEAELYPLVSLAGEKLYLSCRLTETVPQHDPQINSTEQEERVRLLESFLSSLQPLNAILRKYRKPLFVASLYVNNYQAAKNKKHAEAHFESLATEFRQATGELELLANNISYPLQDGKSYAHLTGYFLTGNNQPGSMGQYLYLTSIFERYSSIYTEVMLELLDKLSVSKEILETEVVVQAGT